MGRMTATQAAKPLGTVVKWIALGDVVEWLVRRCGGMATVPLSYADGLFRLQASD